ncbi:nucleoside-diphosphate kinase [Candidatus Woesearchaeota archaeon]|nr:nucleoside-diphosphate kinase [Candidatus Woesearchaeota archaeon]MCF7901607.1 nucleoside-diphosphate kinase [Candidatus Woesearchaeota archaeon]MCF8013520.1 nucleoside-diphosphate kinase [Candidatus Woesearchaeota archaeon]
MTTERSLVLIKPDGVQRGLVGEILTKFEKCGLKIIGMKMVYPTEELAGNHYIADENWLKTVGTKQKEAYAKKGLTIEKEERELGLEVRKQLIDFLTMSPVVAFVFEGHNAVKHIRKLVGSTSPGDAAPGTIRGDYAFDTYSLADISKRPIQNLIHASGEVDEALREIKIWFKEEELHTWKRVDEELLYRTGN